MVDFLHMLFFIWQVCCGNRVIVVPIVDYTVLTVVFLTLSASVHLLSGVCYVILVILRCMIN